MITDQVQIVWKVVINSVIFENNEYIPARYLVVFYGSNSIEYKEYII